MKKFSTIIRETQGALQIVKRAKEVKAEWDQIYPGRTPEGTEQILLSFIVEHGLDEALLDFYRNPPDGDPDPTPY